MIVSYFATFWLARDHEFAHDRPGRPCRERAIPRSAVRLLRLRAGPLERRASAARRTAGEGKGAGEMDRAAALQPRRAKSAAFLSY